MGFSKYVDEKLFNQNKKESLREGFGKGLLEAGKLDGRVLAVCADLTESTKMNYFKQEFPERFIEVGITEQFMASFAAGLAHMGKIPFIASYATFSPGRNWDQIRTTICYDNADVKIVGSHAGVSVGPDGATHQALEDIAMMRVLPNMEVYVPADSTEARILSMHIAKTHKPAYLRLARASTNLFLSEAVEEVAGKPYLLWENPKAEVLIVGAGPVLYEALKAAQQLEAQGVPVEVVNFSTIKPADEEFLLSVAENKTLIATAEEHQQAGGLFSLVSEILSQSSPKKNIPAAAIKDSFGESGEPDELWEKFGLKAEHIKQKILNALERLS